MLILMAGLPGTGKSTLASELARRTGGHVLDKDVVRQALFGPDRIEYSSAQDDLVVGVMLEAAAYLLRVHPTLRVFLDGRLFSRTRQIDEVVAFAERIGTPWRILECVCSQETARRRLSSDLQAERHPAANRSFDLYLEIKHRFELIAREKTLLDTGCALLACVEAALAALGD